MCVGHRKLRNKRSLPCAQGGESSGNTVSRRPRRAVQGVTCEVRGRSERRTISSVSPQTKGPASRDSRSKKCFLFFKCSTLKNYQLWLTENHSKKDHSRSPPTVNVEKEND